MIQITDALCFSEGSVALCSVYMLAVYDPMNSVSQTGSDVKEGIRNF